MKSIDLKKYYPHPLHEGENTVILVTDEVANALERFIREENNDTLRRYRAKAYYSLDCENGIEHHILFREKTPEELYEKKLTMQQLNRALANRASIYTPTFSSARAAEKLPQPKMCQ